MGGTYIDASSLSFNPFANVTDITCSGESIRDQLSVLASPDGNLDEIHDDLLLENVMYAWEAKGNTAHIDDVVTFLKGRCFRQERTGQTV